MYWLVLKVVVDLWLVGELYCEGLLDFCFLMFLGILGGNMEWFGFLFNGNVEYWFLLGVDCVWIEMKSGFWDEI